MRTKSNYLQLPKKKALVTFLVSQAFFSMSAFAAGFQINEISPSLQGDATAGSAAANDDVSSMFINPATLTTLTENQGYLGGSGIFPNVSMHNARATHTVNVPGIPPSNITAPVLGKRNQNSISPSAFVPDAYLSWRINDRLVAGLALVGPFGLKTEYSKNSVVRFAAVESQVKSVDINPALAYAVNDWLSVGAGFQAQYLQAIFSNFNGPYTGVPPIDALIAAHRPTYLKGDGWGYGYNLGVLLKPTSKTRFGIGYRSQISDTLRGHGKQFTTPGGIVPAPSPNFLFNAETPISSDVTTPQILTISAAQDINDWTVKATAQINFWDSFNQLNIKMPKAFATDAIIKTEWRNTWFGALGAEYRANSTWKFRGGVAYDQTPTRDSRRDPRIPDASRVWGTLGASYTMNKHVSFDAAYAHIFMENQTVNVVQASGMSATSTVPLEVNRVHAKYKGYADVVALALRYRFN
jgi:long-chain fatty acid transport protein